MPTPKKSQSKPTSPFDVIGRARAGGELGYKKAARKVIKQETKGMKPVEASAYSKKRLGPLENQMAAERGRTATRAKAQLKKNDKGSYIRETSTKQIDYTGGRKPTYKVTKKK